MEAIKVDGVMTCKMYSRSVIEFTCPKQIVPNEAASLIGTHISLSYEVAHGTKLIRKDTTHCTIIFLFAV